MPTRQEQEAARASIDQADVNTNNSVFTLGDGDASMSALDLGSTPEDLIIELETKVIPRLMLAQRQPLIGQDKILLPPLTTSTYNQSRALAYLALDSDTASVKGYIHSLVSDETPLDYVLCSTVAEAARYMGKLWESDDLSFLDVTIGVSRLQQALRSMSLGEPPMPRSAKHRTKKAAFVPAQGEQHTFGLLIVSEAFRCRGWDVWGTHEVDGQELHNVVATERIDLVGFSLAAPEAIEQLAEQIEGVRAASCTGHLTVLVGGDAFLKNPDLWKLSGADDMATDALDALRLAEVLTGRESAEIP